jgi:hypothetical protein
MKLKLSPGISLSVVHGPLHPQHDEESTHTLFLLPQNLVFPSFKPAPPLAPRPFKYYVHSFPV